MRQFHSPPLQLIPAEQRYPMCEKSTIESLISTSGEDDLEGLPLFYEGKIVKRISKEEIQGWTQNQCSQPFHKKEADSRKRNLTKQRKKTKGPSEKFQDEDWDSPPTLETIKRQLQDYGETRDLVQAFRTFSSLPEIAEDGAPSKPAQQQSPKEDFVKGIRFQSCTTSAHRKTAFLKPLPKPPSISCEKAVRIRSRSVSTAANKSKRRQSEVSVICFPLDVGASAEAERRPVQSKLHSYMRKYQI